MAPEIRDGPLYDHTIDVYSFGLLLLCELYTGTLEQPEGHGRKTLKTALRGLASGAAGVSPKSTVTPKIRRRYGGLRVRYSDFEFETTWDRLLRAVEEGSSNVAFAVDHSTNAAKAGLKLRPLRLLVFGNPSVAERTSFLAGAQTAGIDLPLKILVTENRHGKVLVLSNRGKFLKARHGICDLDTSAYRSVVTRLVSAATKGH